MSQPPRDDAQLAIKAISSALVAFLLFSTHDAIVKMLGSTYSVFQIIFFTSLFAFVPMTVVMTSDPTMDNFRPKSPRLVIARAIASVGSIACAFYAFTSLPLADAYALIFATPILITILSIPVLGEQVGLQRWLAIIVGLAGVFIVLRPGQNELQPGHAAALMAAVFSATASLIARKLGSRERTAVLVYYQLLTNLLVMAIAMPFVYKPISLYDLLLLATVGTLLIAAQFNMLFAYKTTPSVAIIAPMQYSQIIWGSIYGILLFNQFPDSFTLIGVTVIVSSGLFIVWREGRNKVSNSPVLKSSNMRPLLTTTLPHEKRNREPDT